MTSMSMSRGGMWDVTSRVIVYAAIGAALYGVLLVGFFEANAGSATGVNREPFDLVTLFIAQLAWGGILTLAIGWKGDSTPVAGLKTGATAGALFFLGLDLTLYATTNLSNLIGSLADALVATVLFGVAGALIAVVAGKKATG